MAFLPTTLGTRPRLAIEIRPEGIVAARSDDATAVLSAAAHALFAQGIVVPSLKPVNISRRADTVAAVKKALEAVALKNARPPSCCPMPPSACSCSTSTRSRQSLRSPADRPLPPQKTAAL